VTVLATQRVRSLNNLALYAAGFAITAPVGVAIGMIIISSTSGTARIWAEVRSASSPLPPPPSGEYITPSNAYFTFRFYSTWQFQSFCNCIACGIFLFLSLCHIVPRAMRESCTDRPAGPFLKVSAMMLGSAVTSALQFYH